MDPVHVQIVKVWVSQAITTQWYSPGTISIAQVCRSLTRHSATCHLNFFPKPNDIDDTLRSVQVSEDDTVRRQIEDDLQLYGSRPEPPDTVEVDESTQLANLPPKRNASDFKSVVNRLAITSEKDQSKEFNFEALTVMDWNSGASPLDAWLNQSAIPSTTPALDHQETGDLENDLLALETEEIKVFRNVHMAIAPSPEHNDPPLEPVEGLEFGAQIYYRSIMDRFPVLPKYLARRLAQANCDRAARLQHEKEREQKEEEETRRAVERQQELEERRNKERRRAENIEKLNRQLQVLQEMINEYKMDGFVMLSLNHMSERGFTSRAENPAFLEFWQGRNLPSRYLKIEDMEQAVRALEADKQYHNANDHSWRSFQLQQVSRNWDGLPLDHAPSPSSLLSPVPVSATTPPPLVEDCTPPPPVDFWTRGSQSSRRASVHSRSSSMNSSLHGRPAFDPQEQDPTFASELPASTAGRKQSSPALPPAPVELGKVTTFNCDICGQKLEVKRRFEWQ